MYDIEVTTLSKENDFSVPFHLALLRSHSSTKIYCYDYAYKNEQDYQTHLADFSEKFSNLVFKSGSLQLVLYSSILEKTKLNLLRRYEFNLSKNNIPLGEQFNLPIEDKLLKVQHVCIESAEVFKNVISYLVDGYFSKCFLIRDNQYDIVDFKQQLFENTNFKDLFSFTKNRHNQPSGVVIDFAILKVLFKKFQSRILFPYGGFDFGSFIFFELDFYHEHSDSLPS